MELADVTDSKSVGLITRAGSTPATGTILISDGLRCGIDRQTVMSCRHSCYKSGAARRCFRRLFFSLYEQHPWKK